MNILTARARASVTLLTLAAAASVSFSAAVAQTMGEPLKLTSSAIDVNTGRTGRIDISIDRWSTPAEQTQLMTTLFKGGEDDLLDAVRDMRPVGRIYAPGTIGYDLKYAYQRALPDGGREIILATDRPMSFWERWNEPRSAQYPYTWVQLQLEPDGTGEGKLAVEARILGEGARRRVEVETFALQPVRLTNLRVVDDD